RADAEPLVQHWRVPEPRGLDVRQFSTLGASRAEAFHNRPYAGKKYSDPRLDADRHQSGTLQSLEQCEPERAGCHARRSRLRRDFKRASGPDRAIRRAAQFLTDPDQEHEDW